MGTLAGVSPGFKVPSPDLGSQQKALPARMGGTDLGNLVVGAGITHLVCLRYASRSEVFP